MEYLWYIIAALGAGIGTGLAGLSAATVMVPILIVLCPSFAGETGAYQATAIALASDILGSAVTAATYAKHKNIDLKRGWIMMACILSMCTIGSYAAWLAGNVVLGSFTLFLTFCIGIRFLVKPDTTRKETVSGGQKLDAKGIAVSLFFGLTIGFGTGFVGTGGGMMMLIVFTAFLGMELKSAVGTSTFIMTFTALIAATSHIFIHPAIILERWDALLICVVVATVSSLVSAHFANRFANRTVGLITGGVLTVLGATMLILKFWDTLSKYSLIVDTLHCLKDFLIYIIPCVILLLLLYKCAKVPKFIFRKLLHLVAFTCVTLMILVAGSWQGAAAASLVIAAVIYPILAILEKESWFEGLFVQKSPGEIKRSLVLLFTMFAALTAVSWGIFNRPDMVACAILMWGFGDGSAAVIGIPFGRHKIDIERLHVHKSWEGSLAMLAVSALIGILFLMLYSGYSPLRAVLVGGIAALIGTGVELISPSELDTVSVPVVLLAILLLTV